jgi:hypothetical protein
VLDGAPRSALVDQLGLELPEADSASALSYESPRLLTDGITPASTSRSV